MKFSGSHTWFLMDLKDKTVIGNILFEQWQVKKNNSKYNVESRYDSILVYIYTMYMLGRRENKWTNCYTVEL